MELTTAQAVKVLLNTLNQDEPELIKVNGEEYPYTVEAELFVATSDTVYRIIGIDSTETEATFIVVDELLSSLTSGEVYNDKVFTYPIRDSFEEALQDYSTLVAEKVEAHTSFVEASMV